MSSIQNSDSVIICFQKITFIFWVSHKNLKNHNAKLVRPSLASLCLMVNTLQRCYRDCFSPFFLVLLEKERKGLCKHHEPCHDTAENG